MLKYFYDSSGDIRFLLSKSDNFKNQDAFNLYYYMKDGLGNIIGLVRVKSQNGSATVQDRTLVAQYTYDPYGKVESVTRPSGIIDDIYQINPIRYKGYYYDSDSGWYNLKTRYYDPVIARFINTDDVSLIMSSPQAFTDKNLYAYCDNDPINRKDDDGEFWQMALGAFIGGSISLACQVISNKISGADIMEGTGKAFLSGAASGALASTGIGLLGQAIGNAAISSTVNTGTQILANKGTKNFSVSSTIKAGVIGATSGFIGGKGVNAKVLTNTWKSTQKKIAREMRRANIKYANKQIARYTKKKSSIKRATYISLSRYTLGTTFSTYVNRR